MLYVLLQWVSCSRTHIRGRGALKGALQEVGPELRQGLVQVEGGAPVVLSQVGVEVPVEPGVLGVQGAQGRQRLLEGALGTTVQFGEIGWRREKRKRKEQEAERRFESLDHKLRHLIDV